jgi:hypothetical protein
MSDSENTNNNVECKCCDSMMIEDGYDGNYKRFICQSDDCSFELLRPTSDPAEDSLSMEDLQGISEFTNED